MEMTYIREQIPPLTGNVNPLEILREINVSSFLNQWGPTHVVQVYDPSSDMQGILVIDNTLMGPGCGGIKITSTISPREVFERARSKTWTCGLLDLSFGGAAASIRVPSKGADKAALIRAFAKKVASYVPWQFVAAPDLNVSQEEMAAFADEIGDRRGVTGKPERMYGIPYELGVVGFGIGVSVHAAIEAAGPLMGLSQDISDTRIALDGYDSIGSPVANYLSKKGAVIVGICEEGCTIHDPRGIDIDNLPSRLSTTKVQKELKGAGGVEVLPMDRMVTLDCDVLICTTSQAVLRESNVGCVKAKCVVEGAIGPITPYANLFLCRNDVLVIPDLLATAGGAISSDAEYKRNSSERAFAIIESRMRETTSDLVQRSMEDGIPIARLAEEAGKERLLREMEASS